MGVDPTGLSSFVLIWFSNEGEIGHVSYAVENYDATGAFNGTYNIYGKWPADLNKGNMDESQPAIYENWDGVWDSNLEWYDVHGDEPHGPDAIFDLKTTKNVDALLKAKLDSLTNPNSANFDSTYNAKQSNCAGFVVNAIAFTGLQIDASEQIASSRVVYGNGWANFFQGTRARHTVLPSVYSITPNEVFRQLKSLGLPLIHLRGGYPPTKTTEGIGGKIPGLRKEMGYILERQIQGGK
jgi:hypothetical protein